MPQNKEWKEATNAEIKALNDNETWSVVHRPPETTVLKGRQVFDVKLDINGQVSRYKARQIARGDKQRPGIDFDKTYAAVIRSTIVKIIFAIVAMEDLECDQMDLVTAFLNSKIDREDFYMEMPYGYNNGNREFMCKLKKALYSLKQAPLLWYGELIKFLLQQGYRQLGADPYIFIYCEDNQRIIMVYIDDLLIIAKNQTQVNKTKRYISNRFKAKDIGPTGHYLGIQILRDRKEKTLTIIQDAYIDKIMEKFNHSSSRPVSVPIPIRDLQSFEGEAKENIKQRYQAIYRSLAFAAYII